MNMNDRLWSCHPERSEGSLCQDLGSCTMMNFHVNYSGAPSDSAQSCEHLFLLCLVSFCRPGCLPAAWEPASECHRAVVEVHHAVAETAFVQQLKLQANVVGERLFAASHHDGCEEQVALVDQPGLYRLGGKVRTAHRDVTYHGRLPLPD